MSRHRSTHRKLVIRRRHLDLVPTLSEHALAVHHAERRATLASQRYRTGARYGQELAAARKVTP